MTAAPPAPAERLDIILRCLSAAVAAMGGGERLSNVLIGLIIDRIRGIKQCVARLAVRIHDGTYAPRRPPAAPRVPIVRRARPPRLLSGKFGWLLPLVPEAVQFRGQIEHLLSDPEMIALLAAAPASLGRPLRSLCWMLHIDPPIPPPPRPARPKPVKVVVPKPQPSSPQPLPPNLPDWLQDRRKPWSLTRICGPRGPRGRR